MRDESRLCRADGIFGKYNVTGLVFAQLIFFVALLGPAIVGIGIKVQQWPAR